METKEVGDEEKENESDDEDNRNDVEHYVGFLGLVYQKGEFVRIYKSVDLRYKGGVEMGSFV